MINRLLHPGLVLATLLLSSTLCHAQYGPKQVPLQVTPEVTRVLIDSLRQSMVRNYVFPDSARKMGDFVEAEYKRGAYNDITDPGMLARRLDHDLQKAHHDGHFHFEYAPGLARDLLDTTRRGQRDPHRDSMALLDEQRRNFGFTKIEILRGNIGYLLFRGFTGMIQEANPTVAAAFRFLAHTDALIIDLRENGGGSPSMVVQVESYFFPVKTHMNDIVNRLQDRTNEFWTDPERTEGVTLRMPVYILTSKITFSGAEDFTYGMQTIKRAVVIGDTTGGGAHPVGPFPVGQGFVASIPFARSLNPYTHTDWEGTGIYPDIPVPANKALETAEKTIFTDKLAHAANDEEKRSAQWQMDDLFANRSGDHTDAAALTSYTGTYRGGLVFFVKEGAFYCQNAERGNQVFPIYSIAGDKFVLDSNVHVEFKKDEKGAVAGIDMLWSDGRVSYKPKEK